MFILMFLVYYMYLFMPKYKKRTYLLEIDSWKTSGAIGAMKANHLPFSACLVRP